MDDREQRRRPEASGAFKPETTLGVLSAEYRELWPSETPVEPFPTLNDYGCAALEREQGALCLSGGGVRSASFALGMMQALAAKGLLLRFQYLSTVSGGGYAGGWLSRWIQDVAESAPAAGSDAASRVQADMGGQGPSAPAEPRPIAMLRENSNFLTPKVGFASADTWTAAAISLRNVLINWMVFGPALLAVAVLPHLHAYAVTLARFHPGVAAVFLALMAVALAYAVYRGCRDLPSYAGTARPDGRAIFAHVAAPALLASFVAPLALAPFAKNGVGHLDLVFGPAFVVPWAAMMVGYLVAYATTRTEHRPNFRRNAAVWACASALSAGVLCLGVLLAGGVDDVGAPEPIYFDLMTTFGPLVATVAQLLASVAFVAFRDTKGDAALATDLDREWLARISAVKLRPAIAWTLACACVLLLPHALLDSAEGPVNWWSGVLAVLSGAVAVFGGKSPVASMGLASGKRSLRLLCVNALVLLGTALFAALLLLVLSRLADVLATMTALYLGAGPDLLAAWLDGTRRHAAVEWVDGERGRTWMLGAHALLLGATLAALWFTSSKINVNRFSLNGLYRNRLARAFLGGARSRRDPDPFTGFDSRDNIRMHALRAEFEGRRVLLPVVNLALNIVGGDRLAWQERKAEPFVVTPLACGSAMLDGGPAQAPRGAYLKTETYAGNEPDLGLPGTGITLATALTISGAAASPSMGYHSSAPTAFLMTLFNVRLGAWLPNPARAAALGRDALRSGPTNALRPLFYEMAGLTNDRRPDVYLSDGGHFENLGLYEMVRRRCRFIVVSDAGCDPSAHFEDLGNAVRKIKIDLNVDIAFEELHIRARSSREEPRHAYALGRISYPERPSAPGWLLYVKPCYLDERDTPIDIRAYAEANERFPHEPTSDQWFSESQFESYRALGRHLVDRLGERDRRFGSLAEFFDDVRAQAPGAPPGGRPGAERRPDVARLTGRGRGA